jgi:hypothetical protein
LRPTRCVQRCELNRGRTEARALIAFDATATGVDFPFVEQAARLTRCFDSPKKPAQTIETEYLLTSLPKEKLPALQMHLRLDVSAGEDRSRVSKPANALNLALMRRAVISVAVHWIKNCKNPRKATTTGFFDLMSANQRKKAFSLVTARHSTSLSNS